MSNNTKIRFLDTNNIAVADYIASGFKSLKATETEMRQIPSQGGVLQFGASPTTWLVNPYFDWITDMYLIFTVSALTTSGTGTYARYVNDLAHNMIQRIEISSNGNLIKTMYGAQGEMQPRMYLETDYNQLSSMQSNLGDASTTARNAAAAGQQTFYLPIALFHNNPLPVFLLGNNPIQINIFMRQLNQCVQTDYTGGATGTIVAAQMYVEYSKCDAVTKYVADLNRQGKFRLHYHDCTQILNSIPSGQTSYQLQLNSAFNKHVDYLIVNAIASADLSSGSSINPDNWIQLTGGFDVRQGSVYLVEQFTQTDAYNRFNAIPFVYGFNGYTGLLNTKYLYAESFSDINGVKDSSGYGGSKFIDFNDLTLNVYFSSALGAASVVNTLAITSEILVFANGGMYKL